VERKREVAVDGPNAVRPLSVAGPEVQAGEGSWEFETRAVRERLISEARRSEEREPAAARPVRRAGSEEPAAQQTITVSIGRIEVRAAPAVAPAVAPRVERRKGMSLDEYLAQRSRSQR
jgi:hypothetical protein